MYSEFLKNILELRIYYRNYHVSILTFIFLALSLLITSLTLVVTMSHFLRGPSPVCRGCWTSSSRAWGPPPWCLSLSAQCPGYGLCRGSSSGAGGVLTFPGRTWSSISGCPDTPPSTGPCGSCRCDNTECWFCWCCYKLDLSLTQKFGTEIVLYIYKMVSGITFNICSPCYFSSCNSYFSDTSL